MSLIRVELGYHKRYLSRAYQMRPDRSSQVGTEGVNCVTKQPDLSYSFVATVIPRTLKRIGKQSNVVFQGKYALPQSLLYY